MEQWDGVSLDKYLLAHDEASRMTEAEIEASLASLRHQVESATAQGVGLLILSNTHYTRYGRGWASGMNGSAEVVRRWNATELGRRHPAVDVRTSTRQIYPLGVSADRFHTSGAGRYVNAYHWLSALCAWDDVEVPAWARQMMDKEVAREKTNRDATQNIEFSPKGPYRVGDQVTITWKCDPQQVPNVSIYFSPGAGMWNAVMIASNVTSPKYVWTIPETITAGSPDEPQTIGTVSGDCYLRLNAPRSFFRTTEIPFQINPREAKR